MRKVLKRSLCILMSLLLSLGLANMINSAEKVYAYGMTAAATNDYTTWKQTSSSWGEAEPWPNASIPKFGDAGCWITSVAILLRHYNVVTDSNVNTFNPLICNDHLMQYGIVNSAGDFCNLGNIKNAYPGFEYVGQEVYSLSNLKNLYDQGYACIVHETRGHYVAVRSVSSSSAVVMDPGYSTTSLTNSDTIQYFKITAKPQPTVNNPFGYLDRVTAQTGKITVHGWAADMDAPNQAIDVHFYTVQNDQRVWLGAAKADKEHGGISASYPELNNYHGFEATFNTGLNGNVQVEAYGINVGGGGSNTMLWEAPKTVSVPADTESPTISNYTVSDVSKDGFFVSCVVNDNIEISYVDFLVWPDENGNWSYKTQRATLNGNTASCYIKADEHHNFEGNYAVHVQAYDLAGNMTYGQYDWIYVDRTAPIISDVEVVDISETGYTVKCTVTDDHSGINRVQFPTWFEEDNPFNADWSWETSSTYSGKIEDGKYVFKVNTNNYNNQIGKYHTHIYAWDECGNQSTSYNIETLIQKEHKHDYISSIKKEATCTEPGIMLYTCTDNDDSYEEEIPATGHQHTELRNVKKSTCTQEGYTGDTYCKDCNTKLNEGESIVKKSHVWDEGAVQTAATCTRTGVKVYTCTNCQTTKAEEIPFTDHQHTELRNVKEATCDQEGYTGDTYCKDCDIKISSGEVIAKKSHTWDDGRVTTAATCTEKGIKIYFCWGCRMARTEELPSTGHQHTESRNGKEATCTQDGYTGDTYCIDCESKLSSGKSIPRTDHNWDAGKVTQNASCTAKGIMEYACTMCGVTRTDEIPATGHENKVTKFLKEASCKADGYTGDIYCQDCGKLLEEGILIPKTDHTWNTGEVTKAATCTDAGIKTLTCTSCGTTKTETVSATGHGVTEVRNKKIANCVTEGYTGDMYCTICNQKISSGVVVAKTDHSWDGGKVTKQPTTTETGIRTYTCRNCGSTKTETISKLRPQTVTPGKIIKDKSTNGIYKVLKGGLSVEFTKPVSKKASVRIPDTVKVDGITCKVTGISTNAFKNNSSLKTVTIGKNVTVIGTNAFYGCKKLSKVSGGNSIVKIGDRAFANCVSLSSITIAGTVKSIGKQAFYNCKKLRTITIKTSALSSKTIGTKAFTGTYSKPTVRVPAKKLNAYKKLLKSKGMSGKAIYKK